MPKIAYVDMPNFKDETLRLISHANTLVEKYRRQGFDLTLRQLYYQFVTENIFANNEKNYNKLGRVVNDARLAGLIDWSVLKDRGRNPRNTGWFGMYNDPRSELVAVAQQYKLDLWADQDRRVEVWVEKEALEQVVGRAALGLRCVYFANKGYVSQSEMWEAAQRLERYSYHHPEPTLILHVGDHDPSGLDMSRDIEERLDIFGANFELKRVALNMDQIDKYAPPPNPAKMTDSRFKTYRDRFGTESWELDALPPGDLVELLRKHINQEINVPEWQAAVAEEELSQQNLEAAIEQHVDKIVDAFNAAQAEPGDDEE